MTIYTPYTYLIGWSNMDKWYYGSRYAKKSNCLYESGSHPDDLWKTYFTSSKIVKMFRDVYGEPDVIEIRKTFLFAEDAINWEQKALRRIGAVEKSKFINQTDNKAILLDKNFSEYMSKVIWTDERRKAQSEKRKNWIKNNQDAFNYFLKSRNRSEYIYTKERNDKISKSLTGRDITWGDKISENHKTSGRFSGEKNPMFGRSAIKENNMKWYNDGEVEIFVPQNAHPNGYISGKLKRKWYNDGADEYYMIENTQPKHFDEGKIRAAVKYNNGHKEILIKTGDPVPSGYIIGRLPRPKKKWITNGINNILILITEDVPAGYFSGKT
jgi:hypothetical protein